MRLHLGCGNVHIEGYINIDRRYMPGVDRVENIGILQHYPVGGVEEIYSCHALDHFTRWEYKTVLKRWFDLLKPGGRLRISMPDFGWAVDRFVKHNNLENLIGHLYAGQDYPDNVRHWIWSDDSARRDLMSVGFSKVVHYNPRSHWFAGSQIIDDCSQLMDGDRFRSLNLLATK